METEEILAAIQKAADTIATPNWAAIASVVISFLAVIVAGFVAWKQFEITKKQNEIVVKQAEIAEQQNKIALFEKRYEVYTTLKEVVSLAEEIYKANCVDDVFDLYYRKFKEYQWPSKQEEHADYLWMPAFVKVLNNLEQSKFLFSQDIYDEISNLKLRLMLITSIVYLGDEEGVFNDKKMIFYQASEYFKSLKIFENIEADLQLRSIKI